MIFLPHLQFCFHVHEQLLAMFNDLSTVDIFRKKIKYAVEITCNPKAVMHNGQYEQAPKTNPRYHSPLPFRWNVVMVEITRDIIIYASLPSPARMYGHALCPWPFAWEINLY